MKYAVVCVAGTFDRIHRGHETLLSRAFAEGDSVVVGLTSDVYVSRHKKGEHISAYTKRLEQLTGWLRAHGVADRATVIPIDDPYEPAASDPTYEALVVSVDSKDTGETINAMRKEHGLKPLALMTLPMVEAEDHHRISASRIRNGEIDAGGRLILPHELRGALVHPLGDVHADSAVREAVRIHGDDVIVTVGDYTTKALLDAGITPALMIVDHRVSRQEFPDLRPVFARRGFPSQSVVSGPGYISHEAIAVISDWFVTMNAPFLIEVTGEEDLLALPVIDLAPVGTVVYYGQPPIGGLHAGVVEVVVTPERKTEVRKLLRQFTTGGLDTHG